MRSCERILHEAFRDLYEDANVSHCSGCLHLKLLLSCTNSLKCIQDSKAVGFHCHFAQLSSLKRATELQSNQKNQGMCEVAILCCDFALAVIMERITEPHPVQDHQPMCKILEKTSVFERAAVSEIGFNNTHSKPNHELLEVSCT